MKTAIKKILRPAYCLYKNIKRHLVYKKQYEQFRIFLEETKNDKRIFYLGVACEPNLGDIAQTYCTELWIKEHYSTYKLYKTGSGLPDYEKLSFLEDLKKNLRKDDFVVLQSGYGVQDLGGNMNHMHCRLFSVIPEARVLAMPQTIFFKTKNRKEETSKTYSMAKSMLFLSRDKVSHEMAKEMFQGPRLGLYPDIVTTLIGKYNYQNERNGVCLCRRHDSEKYYTDHELNDLIELLKVKKINVDISDTVKTVPWQILVANAKEYIETEIKYFSTFEAVITDKYHGTIFSLAAATPVIAIKTTDHKVVTGLDWFKDVYDGYIYYAESLSEIPAILDTIRGRKLNHVMEPFFKEHYYDKLPELFSES